MQLGRSTKILGNIKLPPPWWWWWKWWWCWCWWSWWLWCWWCWWWWWRRWWWWCVARRHCGSGQNPGICRIYTYIHTQPLGNIVHNQFEVNLSRVFQTDHSISFQFFILGRYFLKTGVYTQDIYSVYYVTKISMMGPTVNILQWSYSMLRNTVFLAPRRRETMLQCSGGLGRVLHQLQNVASLLWRADRRR